MVAQKPHLSQCNRSVLTKEGLPVQTGLPMAALSVAGAQWRLRPEDRMRLNTQLLPWALRAGSGCADLMCIYYEEHFSVR